MMMTTLMICFYSNVCHVTAFLTTAKSSVIISSNYKNGAAYGPICFSQQPLPDNSNHHCHQRSQLFQSLSDNEEDDDDDDEYEDVDVDVELDIAAARRQLENMMKSAEEKDESSRKEEDVEDASESSSSRHMGWMSSRRSSEYDGRPVMKRKKRSRLPRALRLSEHSPPPLTTIMRERREAEIELLESLQYSDTAMSDLWSLWFGERGPEWATRLAKVEALTTKGPEYWEPAEEQLWNIIQECGPYWAEPINRLATLYYLQGRYEESKALCEVVLTLKPWHVGALSGIVLVCAGMGDVAGARMWADRRLPPMPPANTTGGERRTKWVSIFVKEATAKLERAQKQTFKHYYTQDEEEEEETLMRNQQKPKISSTDDTNPSTNNSNSHLDEDDSSSWQ